MPFQPFNQWPFHPKFLLDIFYNKDSAPLDVDMSTRIGNMNVTVSVTNRQQAPAIQSAAGVPAMPPAHQPAVAETPEQDLGEPESESAQPVAPPAPPAPPVPVQHMQPYHHAQPNSFYPRQVPNHILIDCPPGAFVNANIIVPLCHHQHGRYPRFSKRFSNLIVDQFLNQNSAIPVAAK